MSCIVFLLNVSELDLPEYRWSQVQIILLTCPDPHEPNLFNLEIPNISLSLLSSDLSVYIFLNEFSFRVLILLNFIVLFVAGFLNICPFLRPLQIVYLHSWITGDRFQLFKHLWNSAVTLIFILLLNPCCLSFSLIFFITNDLNSAGSMDFTNCSQTCQHQGCKPGMFRKLG